MSSAASAIGIGPATPKPPKNTIQRRAAGDNAGGGLGGVVRGAMAANNMDAMNEDLAANGFNAPDPMTAMKESAMGSLKSYFYNPRIKP